MAGDSLMIEPPVPYTKKRGRVPDHFFAWLFSVIASLCILALGIFFAIQFNHYLDIREARNVVWNEVSYPQGNVGTVIPDRVVPGEMITVTYKEYCNQGVDVRVIRWLDFLDAKGEPVAAFRLTDLEFYGSRNPAGCIKNQSSPVIIPAEIAGRPPGEATVRLRTITEYIKPEQVVQVPAVSEPFTLLDQKPLK